MAKAFKADTCWVHECSDEDWFERKEETRTAFIDGIKERAKLEGCTSIAVFAVPDPLFPLYGHSVKKRVHSEQLAGASTALFEVRTTYFARIPNDVWESTAENLRPALIRRVRDALNERGIEHPGRYEIAICTDDTCTTIERGRV